MVAGIDLKDLVRLSGDPGPYDEAHAAGGSARQATGSHGNEGLPGAREIAIAARNTQLEPVPTKIMWG